MDNVNEFQLNIKECIHYDVKISPKVVYFIKKSLLFLKPISRESSTPLSNMFYIMVGMDMQDTT